MITSKELKGKMEQEISAISNSICERIEKKLNDKFIVDMNKNESAMSELLIQGKIYIGYSCIQRKLQSEFGFDNYSSVWAILIIKAEAILDKKLAEAGWRIDGDYLVPLEEKKE